MSGDGGGSRGKQRNHDDEHEEHVNHEAWVIPYADVLTLLMALFLVMWALGDPNQEKLEVAAESFRRELGGGSSPFDLGLGSGGAGPLASGGSSVLDGAGPAPIAADLDPERKPPPSTVADNIAPEQIVIMPSAEPGVVIMPSADAATSTTLPDGETPAAAPTGSAGTDGGSGDTGEVIADPLDYVEQVVRDHAEGTGLTDAIGFRREARGLVVSIVADKVLFNEARAVVQPDGIAILDVVADAMGEVDNAIIIEGHTDSRPINTPQYPSNWELSTARATSVLRYLVESQGMSPDRVSAAGYADTHPIADGDDPASLAKNRRVEIVVLTTE